MILLTQLLLHLQRYKLHSHSAIINFKNSELQCIKLLLFATVVVVAVYPRLVTTSLHLKSNSLHGLHSDSVNGIYCWIEWIGSNYLLRSTYLCRNPQQQQQHPPSLSVVTTCLLSTDIRMRWGYNGMSFCCGRRRGSRTMQTCCKNVQNSSAKPRLGNDTMLPQLCRKFVWHSGTSAWAKQSYDGSSALLLWGPSPEMVSTKYRFFFTTDFHWHDMDKISGWPIRSLWDWS